ncbi:MAG: SLBB domain-containing protein, partial [Bradyrhizobium sp.]
FNPANDGGRAKAERPGMPAGAAQDDFILSAGDKLDVDFRGQRSSRQSYTVDSQGRLVIDDLQPLTAAGRTIGQIRASLEAEVAALPNEQVFVTLYTVRQIDVLVVGHVRKPGRQTLTVFDTVLDALQDAGGIDKTGSLRQIKLVRDGRSTLVDLYGLLVYGSTNMDLSLRDGDRLIVPPVGATVAIGGGVKRPGIYELPDSPHGLDDEQRKLSLDEMLDLAGGLLTPGQMRFLRLSLTKDGQETVKETGDGNRPQFGDGDILSVAPAKEKRTGTVELAGDVRRPGTHALERARTLSALLGNDRAFGPDIYPLLGLIEREDEQEMAKQWIPFPPLQVVKGKFDRSLQDGDIVHLFSRKQILALQKADPDHLAQGDAEDTGAGQEDDGPLTDPVMISHLRERAAFVRGAVRQPGPWPVADGTTLESVIAASGGLTLEASP